jgi:hypothetical protein
MGRQSRLVLGHVPAKSVFLFLAKFRASVAGEAHDWLVRVESLLLHAPKWPVRVSWKADRIHAAAGNQYYHYRRGSSSSNASPVGCALIMIASHVALPLRTGKAYDASQT